MDERAVQHYLNQVPVEIREAVMELDSPHKWAIYIALNVDGDKYFNQLKKQFNANPNTINKALKALVESGLVAKKVKQLADIGDTNKIYYSTTKLGEKLLTNLFEVVLPPLAAGEMQNPKIWVNKPTSRNIEEIYIPNKNLACELPITQKSLELQLEGVRT
jgi:DNA-binding HxlR family transcriptional regulator